MLYQILFSTRAETKSSLNSRRSVAVGFYISTIAPGVTTA